MHDDHSNAYCVSNEHRNDHHLNEMTLSNQSHNLFQQDQEQMHTEYVENEQIAHNIETSITVSTNEYSVNDYCNNSTTTTTSTSNEPFTDYSIQQIEQTNTTNAQCHIDGESETCIEDNEQVRNSLTHPSSFEFIEKTKKQTQLFYIIKVQAKRNKIQRYFQIIIYRIVIAFRYFC